METLVTPTARKTAPPPSGRTASRAGYVVAIAIAIALLVIVNNLLAWGWVPFLTDEFGQLVGIINVSLGASIVANLMWLTFDPRWFKALCQLGLNAISLAVSVRTWQVFPFDFSDYPEFAWDTVARTIIVISIVGIAVASLVELFKLFSSPFREDRTA